MSDVREALDAIEGDISQGDMTAAEYLREEVARLRGDKGRE